MCLVRKDDDNHGKSGENARSGWLKYSQEFGPLIQERSKYGLGRALRNKHFFKELVIIYIYMSVISFVSNRVRESHYRASVTSSSFIRTPHSFQKGVCFHHRIGL
uniref:Uncharacterized protein n=1 Tax=Ditylum brightwellii TaxID=49249 RepID=A0A7S4SLQ8_9STRA